MPLVVAYRNLLREAADAHAVCVSYQFVFGNFLDLRLVLAGLLVLDPDLLLYFVCLVI